MDRATGLLTRLRRFVGSAPSAAAEPPAADAASRRMEAPATVLCLAGSDAAMAGLAELDLLLGDEGMDLEFLVAPFGAAHAASVPPALIGLELPDEPGRAALDTWIAGHAPDAILWCGALDPSPLLEAVAASRAAKVAVDVPSPGPHNARARRGLRNVVSRFRNVQTLNANAASALRELGLPDTKVETAGPFRAVPQPPECNDADRDAVAQALRARPVWLAAAPTEAELATVLDAHRSGLRIVHRLLLILMPGPETDGPALAQNLAAEGWHVARRSAEEEPSEQIEIFVADRAGEGGLWYRLAPVTFLGGTFGDGPEVDPQGPASLGSALLSGPRWGASAGFMERLDAVSALELARRPGGLSDGLEALMTPDAVAARAHAAWDVVSDGARVQERAAEALKAALGHANPSQPGR
ncbi:MAG: 3-deoxy-D-manno-octulosonic acid transferase [Pseudomonadota bacterium]